MKRSFLSPFIIVLSAQRTYTKAYHPSNAIVTYCANEDALCRAMIPAKRKSTTRESLVSYEPNLMGYLTYSVWVKMTSLQCLISRRCKIHPSAPADRKF